MKPLNRTAYGVIIVALWVAANIVGSILYRDGLRDGPFPAADRGMSYGQRAAWLVKRSNKLATAESATGSSK